MFREVERTIKPVAAYVVLTVRRLIRFFRRNRSSNDSETIGLDRTNHLKLGYRCPMIEFSLDRKIIQNEVFWNGIVEVWLLIHGVFLPAVYHQCLQENWLNLRTIGRTTPVVDLRRGVFYMGVMSRGQKKRFLP